MKFLHSLSFVLVIIGGLNWLLVGLLGKGVFDYVNVGTVIARIVYVLVGLAALILIFDRKSTPVVRAPGSMPPSM